MGKEAGGGLSTLCVWWGEYRHKLHDPDPLIGKAEVVCDLSRKVNDAWFHIRTAIGDGCKCGSSVHGVLHTHYGAEGEGGVGDRVRVHIVRLAVCHRSPVKPGAVPGSETSLSRALRDTRTSWCYVGVNGDRIPDVLGSPFFSLAEERTKHTRKYDHREESENHISDMLQKNELLPP